MPPYYNGAPMQRPWETNWPEGVSKSIPYPEMSLGQMLQTASKRHPQNPALHYSDRGISYSELNAITTKFGRALEDRDICRADRVALYLPNSPEFVVAYFGALRIGATVVAISPLYKERELLRILIDSEAKIIITWDQLLPTVNSARARSKLKHVITATGHKSALQLSKSTQAIGGQEDTTMNAVLGQTDGKSELAEIQPKNDLALLQYTGGTTGTPKGTMLTHYNLVSNAIQFSTWLAMTPQDIHLAALPLFHIYGMTTALNAPTYTSGSIVLISDPRDISKILQTIDQLKPTIFCGVPTMYLAMLNHSDLCRYNLQSIRVCVSGASPLPLQIQQRFEKLTGGRLVEGYGLTEMSPVTHINPLDSPEKNHPGSIGIPISDTDAKIVDVESGTIALPPGIAGELVTRGPQAMRGYWRNNDETAMTLRGGWIYSGDIAVMDSEGYFRIVDRKKDMINVSGLKVWPREVEEILYENQAVMEAAAVAVPDPETGEAVKVFVVLKQAYIGKVSSSEIIEFCKQRIAAYKAPKIVAFRKALPKSSIGKILRRELREQNP
jgi:long-chain acyl-CoA synthetase